MYEELKGVSAETIFEISWEVCNKVGGIYSVITSKAALTRNIYKNYFCVGPYFKKKADEEFSEEVPPEKFVDAFKEAEKEGVKVHYGTWDIKGEPKTLLIEFDGIAWQKNELKKRFWDEFGIDSLFAGWEFEEPMLFSCAVALVLRKMEMVGCFKTRKTVIHVHEWMTGFTIMRLKQLESSLSTVFTTHATILGRSISSNSQNLYDILGKFNPYEKAREIGVIDKFTAERAAANSATVFTTVSEITASEADIILGRMPDVILLNGLDMEKFPSTEEAAIRHVTSRKMLREMIAYTFFPYYKFELEKNLMYYIAGRYEFQNKGIDIFIEALGKMNRELQRTNSERTVTAFFFIAMPNNGVKMELLENKNFYRHLSNYVHRESESLLTKLVNDFISKGGSTDGLFSKEFMQEVRKDVLRFKRLGNPVVCTHKLHEPEENNAIVKAFREHGLNNTEQDKVKVLLVPAYLDGDDSIFNLEFYDIIAGCHFGVFPSYYEPWGYTPLESGALAVPALTTNLAGFGRFIKPVSDSFHDMKKGIYILNRKSRTKHECVSELLEILYGFAMLKHSDRVENKLKAKELALMADWKVLIKNYVDAHNKALSR